MCRRSIIDKPLNSNRLVLLFSGFCSCWLSSIILVFSKLRHRCAGTWSCTILPYLHRFQILHLQTRFLTSSRTYIFFFRNLHIFWIFIQSFLIKVSRNILLQTRWFISASSWFFRDYALRFVLAQAVLGSVFTQSSRISKITTLIVIRQIGEHAV